MCEKKPSNHLKLSHFIIPILAMMSWNCDQEAAEITVAIMGDQTGTHNLDSAYSIMKTASRQMLKHEPDLLLHVGDLTESRVSDSSEFASDFHTAAEIMASVGVPWYLTAGDHDVNPAIYKPLSDDRSNETRFRDLCIELGLPMQDHMYYSAEFQGYHLVFLYSLEHFHTDPRWGSIFLNGISDAQLNWLRADLENHKNSKGILVVVHHPHWYSWSNWNPVHQVLKEYPVIAVLGGHFHYDQDDGVIDGIRYLTIGATGGAIKDADPESGGSHQYALMTLSGPNLKQYELHEVFSDSLQRQTPRRSMDRIQALSSTMSNVFNDEKLFMKDGALMSWDDKGNEILKTRINIESISNPIDLPVELTIRSVDSYLTSFHWVGSNTGISGKQSLILEPGARCGWANYSNTGQWYTPAALWEADVVHDSLKLGESAAIGIKITMAYIDTHPRWIASQISFPIR